MKKQTHPVKKSARMLMIALGLAALPFVVSILSQKVSQLRKIASSENIGSDASYSMDLSDSSAAEFTKAFKYQMLKSATVTDFSDGKKLILGAFLMRDRSGNKINVCEQYPTIELTFTADGIAVSGEPFTQKITGTCKMDADNLHLEGIAIDLPETAIWNWTGLKLIGREASDTLEINGYEIISVLGQPLTF